MRSIHGCRVKLIGVGVVRRTHKSVTSPTPSPESRVASTRFVGGIEASTSKFKSAEGAGYPLPITLPLRVVCRVPPTPLPLYLFLLR